MSTASDDHARSRERATGEAVGGDPRLDGLVGRLPPRIGGTVTYLLQPSNYWVRMPAGAMLVVGGVLWFLPVLGIWMLPLGLALLAEDVPGLRSQRSKVLDWIERRKPHWLDAASRPNDDI